MESQASHVRDGDTSVRQDIQLARVSEFARTSTGAAELAQEVASRIDGDHAMRRVQEVQVSGLVKACALNRVQKLPVGDRSGRPDAVDLREFQGQGSILPRKLDGFLGMTISRDEQCREARTHLPQFHASNHESPPGSTAMLLVFGRPNKS